MLHLILHTVGPADEVHKLMHAQVSTLHNKYGIKRDLTYITRVSNVKITNDAKSC